MAISQISPVARKPEESGTNWLGIIAMAAAVVGTVATAGAGAPGIGAAAGTGAATAGGTATLGAATALPTVATPAALTTLPTAATVSSAVPAIAAPTTSGLLAGGTSAGTTLGLGASTSMPSMASLTPAAEVGKGMGSFESLRRAATLPTEVADTAQVADKFDVFNSMKRLYEGAEKYASKARGAYDTVGKAQSIFNQSKAQKAQASTTMETPQASQAVEKYGQYSEHLQKALAALKTQNPQMQAAYGDSLQQAFDRATKRPKLT